MIGTQLAAYFLDLASNWSTVVFALGALMTVVCGGLIIFNIGGAGVQKHVKSWISSLIWGTLLAASFHLITSAMAARLTFS